MAYTLPDLPYDHAALEPVIDTTTMQIHHGKHHNAYVTNVNKALEGIDAPADVNALISDLGKIPDAKRTAVRNNGGGHANHSLFWPCLAKKGGGGGGEPTGELAAALNSAFGSFDAFKETAERLYLRKKLEDNGWNIKRTAEMLGMQRSNLYKKIERYNLKDAGPNA